MSLDPAQEQLVRKIAREEAERSIETVQVSLLKRVFLTREEFLDAMDRMDKRFEAIQDTMDKRFESIQDTMNKRFEAIQDTMDKRFESMDKRFESMDKRFESMDKRFESMDKRFEAMLKELKDVRVSIDSLGARSGKILEDAILELMRDQLVHNKVEYTSIERETLVDEEGIVFFKGYSTDVDVVAKGNEITLFEIKYKADQRDFAHFMNIVDLYERLKGIKPAKLYLVSLEITSKTLKATYKLPITVIAGKVTE